MENNDAVTLLRAEQVARMLGLCRSKVYAMAAAGELPTVRVGSAVRIPLAALRAWVGSQTQGAVADETFSGPGKLRRSA